MIADNASAFQDVDFLKASLTNFSDSHIGQGLESHLRDSKHLEIAG